MCFEVKSFNMAVQIYHYFIESANRDSFNANLRSIKVLVPNQEVAKVRCEMESMSSMQLNAANAYRAFTKKSKPV